MRLNNKEDFLKDIYVYKLLEDLEKAIEKDNKLEVSFIIAKLKYRNITFEVSHEKIDPLVQ